MALRAVGVIKEDIVLNGGVASIDVNVRAVILGSDVGDYPSATVTISLLNVDPTAVDVKMAVAALVKAEMLTHFVPFGTLDTDTVKIL